MAGVVGFGPKPCGNSGAKELSGRWCSNDHEFGRLMILSKLDLDAALRP